MCSISALYLALFTWPLPPSSSTTSGKHTTHKDNIGVKNTTQKHDTGVKNTTHKHDTGVKHLQCHIQNTEDYFYKKLQKNHIKTKVSAYKH